MAIYFRDKQAAQSGVVIATPSTGKRFMICSALLNVPSTARSRAKISLAGAGIKGIVLEAGPGSSAGRGPCLIGDVDAPVIIDNPSNTRILVETEEI